VLNLASRAATLCHVNKFPKVTPRNIDVLRDEEGPEMTLCARHSQGSASVTEVADIFQVQQYNDGLHDLVWAVL
jgi:hypothetical protein